ncbi:unnamed protein product [Kluyveromyces dobzhanskii CBS 2104]|uniref:WGS project CCBQ000000000 data, contig 00099 n=1 Tax=Kluyveromyces dobzhanskii CBS 2104 TaxID=1427455 RepID=A0A0A8L4U2_9SACH|nr:unnamed protein product [Kluyveromyces dobzhanskii CBS 2104]
MEDKTGTDVQLLKKRKIGEDEFSEIKKIFFRLNTFYTFLLTRNHVITTFDTLKPAVQKAVKRPIVEQDLAKICVIMPGDTVFKFMDRNQFQVEEKIFDFKHGGYQQKDNDIFELKAEDNQVSDDVEDTQVLVFQFSDGNMANTWKKKTNKGDMNTPDYTTDAMKKMIAKRKVMFESSLNKFIFDCKIQGKSPSDELERLSAIRVPKKKDFMDPIESMLQAKRDAETTVLNETGDSRPMIPVLLEKIKRSSIYNDQITNSYIIPERLAQYGKLEFELSVEVYQALEYKEFYSHQAAAMNSIHNRENVIITTSTSSGKSLIYQLSAIDMLLKDPHSTFMYIFPTKALAQDQKRSFQKLLSRIPELSHIIVDTYDGDTEQQARAGIRISARVIFTNPDMIHTSILPNHPNWKMFLDNLRYVVVDELHIYKGFFGSHVALVMRRLARIVKGFYNNEKLQFISCSATLKHPIQHMKDIFGVEQVTLINEDGSPRGTKHLVVWNPPKLSQHERKRENFIAQSAKILVQLIVQNVRTIAFCFVRRVCELLMKEVRVILQDMGKLDLINEVMSYRGGYSASDRRKIEQEMFHGNLRAVVSTNALELGIDIGGLDSVLMCGFPLSLANFHQQSGRAGRRNKDSLTLVVASDSPVDQHYVAHSESLLEVDNPDSYQDLVLDFDNMLMFESHIQCAAFELPIDIDRDSQGSEEDIFAVVDITNGRNVIIEEVEASRTSFTLYDGGIFIHQGYPYLVREFNPDEKFAKVQRVDVDWTTSQRDFTDVDPEEIESIRSMPNSDIPVYYGKIKNTIIVFGFFKIDKQGRILDAIETHNPPVIINSKGFWIDIPKRALEIIQGKSLNTAGGIHAAQHAILGLLPRFIVTGVDEISTECKAPEKEFAERQTSRKRPARLVFYDSKGGKQGSGLCMKTFEHIEEILIGALQRVEECPCEDGCPECVAAAFCKESSLVLSKPASLVILHCILGHKESSFISRIKDGPEPNMPEIRIETIVPVSGHVKFSKDIQIIDVRKVPDGEEKMVTVKKEDEEESNVDGLLRC